MKVKKLPVLFLAAAVICSPLQIPFDGITTYSPAAVSAADTPDIPENITAYVQNNSVIIKWDKSSGADGYRIYKYDSSTKKFTYLKTVSGTQAVIRDLSAGKYYFKIAPIVKADGKYIQGKLSEKIAVTVPKGSSDKNASEDSSDVSDSVKLAKEMGNGWNLGNTMESVASWLGSGAGPKDYEKAWGQPETTEAMIRALKNNGFDSVRIPVAWSNMMSDDGKYTISPEYFKRVDEIVGYVLDSDMYCIINIHWDGGWWEDFGSQDEKTAQAAMDKYTAMWDQIAKHYSSYSDKLIFESANEELGSTTRGKVTVKDSYARVNAINQKFVDIVRSSGGKNKKRFLLIAGYDTDISKTADDKFVMPDDTVKGRLLVSVHYYTPSTFCIADNENNSWGYMESWGTQADINAMRKDFEKMKKFTDAGYGVIIGEYGVSHKKDGTKYTVKKGTDLFFKSVTELSKEYGYCAMLWDCNDWFSRNTLKFNYDYLEDIYNDGKKD